MTANIMFTISSIFSGHMNQSTVSRSRNKGYRGKAFKFIYFCVRANVWLRACLRVCVGLRASCRVSVAARM